jgi:hypothetical protein
MRMMARLMMDVDMGIMIESFYLQRFGPWHILAWRRRCGVGYSIPLIFIEDLREDLKRKGLGYLCVL